MGRSMTAALLACCLCSTSAWVLPSLSPPPPPFRPSPTCTRRYSAGSRGLLSLLRGKSDGVVWREGAVEPGCVLVASPEEADHFFRHAVVLLLEHSDSGSKGVLLEMATAFTLEEMAPAAFMEHPLGENSLFRGGSSGSDRAIMVHALEGVQTSKPIGRHGVFAGGMQEVKALVTEGKVSRDQVKFFFNHCEWLPGQLEREIAQKTWRVGFIPPELCMRQVSSQSERIKMVEGPRFDSTKPLWDIIQEDESFLLTSSSASSSSLPSEVKKEASTTPAHEELSQNRKLFFELLLQRIIDFRITGDVDGVLVLLDAGADVYEMKGAGKIKSVLQEKWSQQSSVVIDLRSMELQGEGTVSVKYALRAQGGDSTLGSEEIIFSSSGLVRSIRAHG